MKQPTDNELATKWVAALPRFAFAATFLSISFVVIAKAVIDGVQMDTLFARFGSDEQLRLVSIRNWMGGQPWFDTTEYRMMPPDGVLIHWSRYIDAMIGGLIAAFSTVVPVAKAEMLAVTVWPTFLQLCVFALVGVGAKRLFGVAAACFAMLCAFTWLFTSQFYFRPGQIDHHNVQVLMIILMTVAAVWPGRPALSGVICGVAAGFALAVGLETLPYILLLGLMLFLRASFAIAPYANRLLVAFCLSLFASGIVFWLGQTPPSRLLYPVCDQLGMPVLSLIATANAASILPIILGMKNIPFRFIASLAIVGLGFAITWPLLGGCLAGPYGSLPVEVQEIIRVSIIEALPGFAYALRYPLVFLEIMLPVASVIIVAAVLWWKMDKSADVTRDAVGQLLILSAAGILASFSQIRLGLMAAGAVPLLAGFVLAALLSAYRKTRSSSVALQLMLIGVLVLAPHVVTNIGSQFLPKTLRSGGAQDRMCRDKMAMDALNQIPPGVFLSPMNLSSLILRTTHHSVLSGPYHRSPDAFANGKIPFRLPDAELQAYVARIGAEYLIICEGSNYGQGFANVLADGGSADWLQPVGVDTGPILIFKVLQDDGT